MSLSVNDLLRLSECFTNSNESVNSILSLQAEWMNRMNINENLLDSASLLQSQRLQHLQERQTHSSREEEQTHSSREEEQPHSLEGIEEWIEEYYKT